jgi:hypothetical protein
VIATLSVREQVIALTSSRQKQSTPFRRHQPRCEAFVHSQRVSPKEHLYAEFHESQARWEVKYDFSYETVPPISRRRMRTAHGAGRLRDMCSPVSPYVYKRSTPLQATMCFSRTLRYTGDADKRGSTSPTTERRAEGRTVISVVQ